MEKNDAKQFVEGSAKYGHSQVPVLLAGAPFKATHFPEPQLHEDDKFVSYSKQDPLIKASALMCLK